MAKDVVVFSPTGERGVVPREQLKEAMAQGYRLPTQSEYDQADLEKKYEETPTWQKWAALSKLSPIGRVASLIPAVDEAMPSPPAIQAVEEGIKRSVGIGPVNAGALGQSVTASLDPGYAEKVRQLRSAYPTTSLAGEITGGVGTALQPAGTSQLLSGYAQSPLAKLAARGAGTVADTVGWGMSRNLADGIMEGKDGEALAEKMMASVGTDALWGIGGFAAGETIGGVVGAVAKRGSRGVPKLGALEPEAQQTIRTIDEMLDNSFKPDGSTYKFRPKSTEQIVSWAKEQNKYWSDELQKSIRAIDREAPAVRPEEVLEWSEQITKGLEWEPAKQAAFGTQTSKLAQRASATEMTLEDLAKYVEGIPEKNALSSEYKNHARAFLFDLLEKQGAGPEYEQAKRFWIATKELQEMSGGAAGKSLADAISPLTSMMGVKGWAAGKVLGVLDAHLGEATARSAVNAVLNRQAVLAHVRRVDDTIAGKVRQFIESSTPPSSSINPFRDIHEDFDKTSKEISDAGSNLPYTTQQMANAVHGISWDMKPVSQRVTLKGTNTLQNLRMRLDAMHQSIAQPKSVTPLAAPKTQLPDSAKYQWLREQRAVRQPLTMLDDMRMHQVYPPAVEALKENWPKLYEQIAEEIVTQASEVKQPLTRAQYEVIAQVLGQPSDGVAGDQAFGDWVAKMAYNPSKKSSIKSIGNQRSRSPGSASMAQTDSQRTAMAGST